MASQPYPDTAGTQPADGKAVPVEPGVQVLPDAESPPKNYVPEGFDSVDDFLNDALEQYHHDREADSENIAAALDDRYFFGLDQWDDEVVAYRDGLPCLTIDSLGPQVAQVIGDWRVNKVAIKVLPKESGDVDVASIRSDLIHNIEVQSRAPRVYTAAFTDQVVCGIGAMKICLDYTDDDVFEQDIVIKRVPDPLSVTWDRMSTDPTGKDAVRCFLEDALPRKVYEERWPDKPISELSTNYSDGHNYARTDDWHNNDTVRVAEYWRMITRKRTIALLDDGTRDGKVIDITDKEPTVVTDMMTGQPVELYDGMPVVPRADGTPYKREVDKRYAQMHLITAQDILEGPYELPINRLPIIKVTGNEIRIGQKALRWGLIRPAKDAQRLKNFWRSVEAEQLGYQVNQPWIAADDAVEGYEKDYEQQHLTKTRLLKYKAGTQEPRRVEPPRPQAALITAAQQNAQDIKDSTGIHNAMLGIQSNETSGRAIMARQREGDISTYLYPDNMNESVLELGSVANQLIDIAYDAPRTVRIVGEDEEPKLKRINDPNDPDAVDLTAGKYDVVISTGPSYTTRRQEAFDMISQVVQSDPTLMRVFGDLLFKAMDAPMSEELAARMRKTIPPELLAEDDEEPAIPPQLQQQMQEMMQAIEMLKGENDNLKEDRSMEQRKLDIDAYGKETDRIKAVTAKDFPLGPQGAAELQAVVAQAVREVLASPDVLPMGHMQEPGQPQMEQPQMQPMGQMEQPPNPMAGGINPPDPMGQPGVPPMQEGFSDPF